MDLSQYKHYILGIMTVLNGIIFFLFQDIYIISCITCGLSKMFLMSLIISMLLGLIIYLIAILLFTHSMKIERSDIIILFWGASLVIFVFEIENIFLLDMNNYLNISGAGLRVYTWNYMFIIATIEEISKTLFAGLMIYLFKRRKHQMLILTASAFIIFENILFMKFFKNPTYLIDRLLDRLENGTIVFHLGSMIFFMIAIDIKNTKHKLSSIIAYILSLGILCMNIYIHLLVNYNLILLSRGTFWMTIQSPTTIAWGYFIMICILVNLSRIKFVNIQHKEVI